MRGVCVCVCVCVCVMSKFCTGMQPLPFKFIGNVVCREYSTISPSRHRDASSIHVNKVLVWTLSAVDHLICVSNTAKENTGNGLLSCLFEHSKPMTDHSVAGGFESFVCKRYS